MPKTKTKKVSRKAKEPSKTEKRIKTSLKCTKEDCLMEFTSKRSFSAHLRKHNISTGLVPCTICSKEFTRKDTMIVHRRIHTGELPHPCYYCEKKFLTRSNLFRHLCFHTGEKPFCCKTCDKSCSSRSSLRMHMKTHGEKEYFPCKQCDKKYSFEAGLKYHVKAVHRQEKPFSCEVCDKCFSGKQTLIRHLQTHTGEKKYPCQLCTKSFVLKSDFDNHNYTHTGNKPFKCPKCPVRVCKKSTLNFHMKKQHLFQCKICLSYHESEELLSTHTCPIKPRNCTTISVQHLLITTTKRSGIPESVEIVGGASSAEQIENNETPNKAENQKDQNIEENPDSVHVEDQNIEENPDSAHVEDYNLLEINNVANFVIIENEKTGYSYETNGITLEESKPLQNTNLNQCVMNDIVISNVIESEEKSQENDVIIDKLTENFETNNENVKINNERMTGVVLSASFENVQPVVQKLPNERKIRIMLPFNESLKTSNAKPRKFIIIKEILD